MTFQKVGVLLHGMGGWGKSSIASRLWDRLPEHEKILWWRKIDEPYLIKKLKSKLISSQTRKLITDLEDNQLELKYRLADLFSQLSELGEKPFLFILDDFEWNLEHREGRYILKPEVAPILKALVEAIQETGTDNKIIITCRYEFDSELLEFFFSQGLEPLRKAELTKKLNRLEHFNLIGKLPKYLKEQEPALQDLQKRALDLANGNPRLLEFLNNDILGKEDTETKLTELEQSTELWKDQIIHEELYQLIDEPLQQILSYCLVYNLRVPKVALEAVCDSLPNYQQQLRRGLDLGLIEMSPEPREEDRVYRVSRILLHIIPSIRLPNAPDVYSLYRKANNKLYQLWGHRENESEEKWWEIFRLLFADKENPERFRQGFYQMLAVQYNSKADAILEFALRQLKDELSEENVYSQLEDYLRQGDWKKADEETAWLFYLVMVKQGYQDWVELCGKFPSETLNEIDRLWVNYSQGHFGFSVQKRILSSLREKLDEYNSYFEFARILGWYVANKSKTYNSMPFSNLKSPEGQLPVLTYQRNDLMRIALLQQNLNDLMAGAKEVKRVRAGGWLREWEGVWVGGNWAWPIMSQIEIPIRYSLLSRQDLIYKV